MTEGSLCNCAAVAFPAKTECKQILPSKANLLNLTRVAARPNLDARKRKHSSDSNRKSIILFLCCERERRKKQIGIRKQFFREIVAIPTESTLWKRIKANWSDILCNRINLIQYVEHLQMTSCCNIITPLYSVVLVIDCRGWGFHVGECWKMDDFVQWQMNASAASVIRSQAERACDVLRMLNVVSTEIS